MKKYFFKSELNTLGISEYVMAHSKEHAIEQLMKIYGMTKKEVKNIIE